MKTKDFIKMLQEADPTGEGYIRLPDGGAPWFAEQKPGYWDGPYQYLEKINPEQHDHAGNFKLVTSTKGYKIDIHTLDSSTIVWDEDGNMDEIRKRIVFDYAGYGSDIRSEKEERHWKAIEDEAKFARDHHEKSLIEWTDRVIREYVDCGYEIRQPLDKPIGYYHCMTAHTLFTKKNFCQGECMAVIMSGKFYPEKGKNYYVWKYDPEKGKDWSIR